MSNENKVSDNYVLPLSKQLEVISLGEISRNLENEKKKGTRPVPKLSKKVFKVTPHLFQERKKPKTQIELFQKSMKLLLICGQCVGLIPVVGITNDDVSKMRFTVCSLRFIYSSCICISQATFTVFSIKKLVTTPVSITTLAFVSFYAGTFSTTILCMRIGLKWPSLMKKIANSSLDKYVDVTLKTRCKSITVVLLTLAVFEHLLSQKPKIMDAFYCATANTSVYELYLQNSFPWFKEIQYPLYIPAGIFLNIINVVTTINWSYSDVFIVCLSLYLVSILEKINKTINEIDLRFYHPTFWSTIREDYTRATRLVTSFDEVISGVMLISFASNLFFICLQLFHILSHRLDDKTKPSNQCLVNVSRTMFNNLFYFSFSLIFVLGRFFSVSLVAASIHTASRAPAMKLYMVPSTAYCNEVQRFIEQVHGNTVALSGLQFFYITKALVLTVAGTIVTYELVLLQFNGEDVSGK